MPQEAVWVHRTEHASVAPCATGITLLRTMQHLAQKMLIPCVPLVLLVLGQAHFTSRLAVGVLITLAMLCAPIVLFVGREPTPTSPVQVLHRPYALPALTAALDITLAFHALPSKTRHAYGAPKILQVNL